ncbi:MULTISPECIES: hypothetical protein [unclassified Halomonas]|uniref:hypothetical protein n=1 Tax=unclassified Halomonas TaxID=2609666 RepID=UPI0020A1DF4F|nr:MULTISPECIES: hypothetical protein [unclassified Halomonas]MCP1315619.1 hypothetical protein [Halomonas sp. 707D7]MCP1327191.1 hypothetical protein [Halomonas sp. 707D4]
MKRDPREGTIRTAERWLDASSELAQNLVLTTGGQSDHVVLSGSTIAHRRTDSGRFTEHWAIGIQLEQLDDEGKYQASEAYIYIDPRGGIGSDRRYTPSTFRRRDELGSWQQIEL